MNLKISFFALRLFVLTLCFGVEVRVQAADAHVVSIPKNCHKKSQMVDCSLAVRGETYVWSNEVFEARSSVRSLLSLEEEKLHVFSGDVWMTCRGNVQVETRYLKLDCQKGDGFLISIQGSEHRLTGIRGLPRLQVLKEVKGALLPGAEYRVGKNLQASPPLSARRLDLMGRLSPLFSGDADDFKKELLEFEAGRKKIVETLSLQYQNQVERTLASEKSKAEKRARRRAKAAAEDRKLRRLFRQKTLFGL